MNQIISFFENTTTLQVVDLLIAIGIILFLRIFSGTISYIIIRMFKIKEKKAKSIKESAFYSPLKIFFIILGFYLAIVFLKEPFHLTDDIMAIAYQAFIIISTIAFAKALATSFTPKSSFYNKLREKTGQKVEDSMFDFALKIIRMMIYIVAAFIVITTLGVNLNGLVAGLGIGGVIFTLAAQDTAKNLFAGVVVFLDKPFIVGDWIEIENFEGTVEDITFRSTRVRTFENSVVNIPNAILSNASIINWSKMEKRRYRMNLCIELDTPLEKLQRFQLRVQDMLQARDAIYDDSIIVKFDTISDNGLNILICSYTDSIDYNSYIAEREDINYKIMKILKEENIELAYDTKTVHVKNNK
ncbi:MAG: mechanosensitive ion channel family protein [Clostridia bacterium]|nr:mechanosensitive ion channel family protein [Clostridia bacterium]